MSRRHLFQLHRYMHASQNSQPANELNKTALEAWSYRRCVETHVNQCYSFDIETLMFNYSGLLAPSQWWWSVSQRYWPFSLGLTFHYIGSTELSWVASTIQPQPETMDCHSTSQIPSILYSKCYERILHLHSSVSSSSACSLLSLVTGVHVEPQLTHLPEFIRHSFPCLVYWLEVEPTIYASCSPT